MSTATRQPSSRMCFICGRENPVGLKMTFEEDREAGQVRSSLIVPDCFQGYPGVVHGGIVAAVLDETAGRAILLHGSDEDVMATLRLTIRYRRPTPTGVLLTAVGWLEHRGGAGARVSGELRLPDGTVTADCSCTLAEIPESFRVGWEEERKHWRVTE